MKLSSRVNAAVDWFVWFFDQPQGVWWAIIFASLNTGVSRVWVDRRGGIAALLVAAVAFGVLKVISYRRGEPAWPRFPVSRDGGKAVGGGEQNSKRAADLADSAEGSSRR